MREVTIFRDIITDLRLCDRDYIEEVSMNRRAFDYAEEGASPKDETLEVWCYPVETFSWNELDPKGGRNPWDGSPAYIRHEFHYAATNQFKEKFKIFFDAHEALKNENATNEYILDMEKTYHSKCLKDLLETSSKLNDYRCMSFWGRLKFLFKGEL